MNTIAIEDTVWATATFKGRVIASFQSSGFSSVADVLNAMRKVLGNIVGIVQLSVRNASRGWRQERSLFIAPMKPGIQLSLF